MCPPPPHTHIYKHSDDFFKCTMAASLPGPWTPCLEFHGTNIKEKTFNFAHPCHLFLPTHYIFQNFHWNEYHIGCMFIFLINYVSSTMFFLIPQNGLGFIPENIEATINIYVQEHWFNWGGGGVTGVKVRGQLSEVRSLLPPYDTLSGCQACVKTPLLTEPPHGSQIFIS